MMNGIAIAWHPHKGASNARVQTSPVTFGVTNAFCCMLDSLRRGDLQTPAGAVARRIPRSEGLAQHFLSGKLDGARQGGRSARLDEFFHRVKITRREGLAEPRDS